MPAASVGCSRHPGPRSPARGAGGSAAAACRPGPRGRAVGRGRRGFHAWAVPICPVGPLAKKAAGAVARLFAEARGQAKFALAGAGEAARIDLIAPALTSASGAILSGDDASSIGWLFAASRPAVAGAGGWGFGGGGLPTGAARAGGGAGEAGVSCVGCPDLPGRPAREKGRRGGGAPVRGSPRTSEIRAGGGRGGGADRPDRASADERERRHSERRR